MDGILIPPIDAEQAEAIRQIAIQIAMLVPLEFWKYAALAIVVAVAHDKVKWVYAMIALWVLFRALTAGGS